MSAEDQLAGRRIPDRLSGDGRGTSSIIPAEPAQSGSGSFHAEADQIGRWQ